MVKLIASLHICICVIFTKLTVCNACIESRFQSKNLVYSTTEKVGLSDFRYKKLNNEGSFCLVLKTLRGDADLYISSSTNVPDYTNYEYKSASYGDEIIKVNHSMKRPIYLGVFGHPGKNVETVFELKVFSLTPSEESESPAKIKEEESFFSSLYYWLLKAISEVIFV